MAGQQVSSFFTCCWLCGGLVWQAAGLIFFHMLLVVWWFGVRCLHFLLDRAGCRSHLFSHIAGCVVVWCEVFAHGWTAGLIFFHMLLVAWWFAVRCLHMVPGRRSHLFSHVAGCVVVCCEMFALTGWFVWGKCRGAWVKCLLVKKM